MEVLLSFFRMNVNNPQDFCIKEWYEIELQFYISSNNPACKWLMHIGISKNNPAYKGLIFPKATQHIKGQSTLIFLKNNPAWKELIHINIS